MRSLSHRAGLAWEHEPVSWDERFAYRYDEWAAHMTEDIALYVGLAVVGDEWGRYSTRARPAQPGSGWVLGSGEAEQRPVRVPDLS
jgi:hypothetical protein